MIKISFELPIKTVSEANCSQHWSKKSRRHRQQQFFVRSMFNRSSQEISLPCAVKLVRIAQRDLDGDNLISAFKWIRDEVSECLCPESKNYYLDKKGKERKLKGRQDSNPLITWIYDQEKDKKTGIRIEIESLAD